MGTQEGRAGVLGMATHPGSEQPPKHQPHHQAHSFVGEDVSKGVPNDFRKSDGLWPHERAWLALLLMTDSQ